MSENSGNAVLSEKEGPLAYCPICSKQAALRCSRCLSTYYCSKDHQRDNWKSHKKACFAPGVTCTRCLEPALTSTPCAVPHPAHLQHMATASYMGSKWSKDMICRACSKTYTLEGIGRNSAEHVTRGPNYCFEGCHTIKPLKATDDRWVRTDLVVLNPDTTANMQESLNNMPAGVRVLVIEGEMCDGDVAWTLNTAMPELQELKIMDIIFGKIHLTPELTPELRSIELQNIEEDCDIKVIAPNLERFSIRHHHPDDDAWVNVMLRNAPKLQVFDSYKLRVSELHFYSNHLHEIDLHRAELLMDLTIYAPNLKALVLQGCYSLHHVKLLNDYQNMRSELPCGHGDSKISVNTLNANLSREANDYLRSHPRVVFGGPAHQGMPTESMFANMHSMNQFGF